MVQKPCYDNYTSKHARKQVNPVQYTRNPQSKCSLEKKKKTFRSSVSTGKNPHLSIHGTGSRKTNLNKKIYGFKRLCCSALCWTGCSPCCQITPVFCGSHPQTIKEFWFLSFSSSLLCCLRNKTLCSRSVAWISHTRTSERRFFISVQSSDMYRLPML